MQRKVDYLIVGQGLAGTCLAFTLEHYYKKSVFIIDRDAGAHCSNVAAGSYNPLGFRTMSPTWRADEFIPYLNVFYADMEKALSIKLLKNRPVFKTFKNEEQRKQWLDKCHGTASSGFMCDLIIEDIVGLKGRFGYGKVKGSGNLDIQKMIATYRTKVRSNDSLYSGELGFSELVIDAAGIQYQGIQAKKLIFCRGIQDEVNPFFEALPFKKTKGEVLIINIPGFDPKGIVHNNINLVPMQNGLYWVGSTFDWNDESLIPTEASRTKLMDQIDSTISLPYNVVDQWVGMRPTVKDRRPMLGSSSVNPDVLLFNGLGSRGSMLAPFMAKEMAEYMESGKELDREIDVSRFNESA